MPRRTPIAIIIPAATGSGDVASCKDSPLHIMGEDLLDSRRVSSISFLSFGSLVPLFASCKK